MLMPGHICMYVGFEIPKQVYAESLKGTDADTGEPEGEWVSSHYGDGKGEGAALGIGGPSWAYTNYYGSKVRIYRCVSPEFLDASSGAEE